MQIHQVKTYGFAELSETAQARALDANRDWNVDHDWWDHVYESARDAARMMGIEVDEIYFSGFWSQGDGACFTGRYAYAKGAPAAIRAEWPMDEELQAIARELQDIQRRHFYGLSASVAHSGRYCHEYSTTIDVQRDDYGDVSEDDDDGIAGALRDFMRWIYRALEELHDYLTSDEAVRESLEANEVEFLADGSRY